MTPAVPAPERNDDRQRPETASPQRPIEFGFINVLDVNGDGRNDLVTTSAHAYGVYWFEQMSDGLWKRHLIDDAFSESHANEIADINGDGQWDLITGKRYMARNMSDPGVNEPLGIYWYEFRRGLNGEVDWCRHTISEDGITGGGLQLVARDIDNDGDIDVISGGKSGLFLLENLGVNTGR